VEAFRRAVYSLTSGYGRINLELARGLLTIGEPREAIVVLGGVLRGPLDAANLYVSRTEVHRLLSEAYSAVNVPDSAALHAAWVERALSRETTAAAR
jgi:predicted nucleic acid-binding protein